MSTVRKEAVALVNAFDFSDVILNSALGRYDGDVYKHLYQWAQRAPRNKKKVHNYTHFVNCPHLFFLQVHDVYEKYLKGMLKQIKANFSNLYYYIFFIVES